MKQLNKHQFARLLMIKILALSLLIVAPCSNACDLTIQEYGNVVWFIKNDLKQVQNRYYAAVLPVDFQLSSLTDLKEGRALGQDYNRVATLPDKHGTLYVISSSQSINSLADYQITARGANSTKGFSNYGMELQTSFLEYDGSHGSKICRW